MLFVAGFISTVSYFTGKNIGREYSIIEYSEMEKLILIREVDTFEKNKLIQMLKDLNVKFPHIVMAQSIIETGKWNSKIFRENHNLFGMKEAKRRITTAGGTQYNHAYYNHWRESVYDYAFYQCRYLHTIRTDDEYFQYLGSSYAESPNYVETLKKTIQTENLKALFD
jgi:flagellum-specific peptidoglycan hydrolase FlgJ